MKRQLRSLDTHLMSIVLLETMLGRGSRKIFVFEDGKLAGFIPSSGGRMWRGHKSEAFLHQLLLVPKLTLEFPRVSHPNLSTSTASQGHTSNVDLFLVCAEEIRSNVLRSLMF